MKAILCKELTGHQNLQLEEIDAPVPNAGEVQLEVDYAAINFFDTLITRGKYQYKPELPFAPGGEVAGRITELGPDVTGIKTGDRVIAYLGWGGCQQKVVVNQDRLIPIPDHVSSKDAASLIITYGTAMHGLVERGGLKAGEMVAILGAGGGAGLAAVEVASAVGARIIAVASTEDKLALAREKGAQEGLNCSELDLKKTLKQITGGAGVDVVYDCVGGNLAEPALRAVKWNGRYLVVGFAAGEIPSIPLNLIMLKGVQVKGVFLGRFIKEQPEDYKAYISQLFDWISTKSLTPHINAIYPLEETVKAIDVIAERKALGKILVEVTPH